MTGIHTLTFTHADLPVRDVFIHYTITTAKELVEMLENLERIKAGCDELREKVLEATSLAR